MGVTNDEIIKAINSSSKVEANAQKNSLRRKNNKALETKIYKNKHNDEEETKAEHHEVQKAEEGKYEPLEDFLNS